MSKKIALIVDDEPDLRSIVSDLIQSKNYETVEANNGLEALAKIDSGLKPSLIISDIRMPVLDGLGLFNGLSERSIKVPFIFMTGFSEVLDMKKAYDMGATEFLSKPFSNEELNSCIELIEGMNQGTNPESKITFDFDYCRIHIDEFLSGKKTTMDVFLKVGENKYIRVAKRDSPITSERIDSYKRKGLSSLYIKKEDFAEYVGLNLSVAKAVSKIEIPKHRKFQLLKHSLETMVQHTYVNGMDKEKFQNAKELVETTINVVFSQNDLFNMLDMLSKHSDQTYAHSLAVSLYASAVCDRWGWTAASTLNRVAMAGLFHDIGKKEISQSLLTKSRLDMTADEIKIYESHAKRGGDLLALVPGIPEEVISVALQHHELPSGRGFPSGLTRIRTHPMAKIISTVNQFVRLVLNPSTMSAKEALFHLYDMKKEDMDLQVLKALMEIFKYPVPPDMANLSAPNTTLR